MFIGQKINGAVKRVILFIHRFFLTQIVRHEKNIHVIVATMLGGDQSYIITSSDQRKKFSFNRVHGINRIYLIVTKRLSKQSC